MFPRFSSFRFVFSIVTGVLLCVSARGTESSQTERTNVVFFLIDDLGWMDLGCQGSKFYRTPHIDQLANQGMRFTDPEHQGFELNVAGRDYGAPGSYFFPFEGTWNIPTTKKKLIKTSPIDGEPGDYLIDRIAEEGERFIRANSDEPFFLMMSHYGVHAPLQGKPEKVAHYEGIHDDQRQGHPHYGAMVESIDDSVGRIMRTLREVGLAEKTLVIFTSDNGGFAKATDNSPLRANKGSNYEGGIRD